MKIELENVMRTQKVTPNSMISWMESVLVILINDQVVVAFLYFLRLTMRHDFILRSRIDHYILKKLGK